MEPTKTCSKCLATKQLSEFPKSKGACRKCKAASAISYYHRVKKERNYTARFRSQRIKKQYNLTDADFNQMLLGQDNKCAICFRTFTDIPHIDHNHTTGKVRGLLCGNCNRGIGIFGDNPDTLENAIHYLLLRD